MSNRISRRSSIAGLLRGACLAASAGLSVTTPTDARPCSWSIGSYLNGFVPDFDQKRESGPLFWNGSQFVFIPAGLPGEGVAYCSPTAHTNWMAYFANHGFPALMRGGSSPSFQSQSEYENVTATIAELGVDMQTHPSDGTTCCGTSGMQAYLQRHAPNKFIVSAFAAEALYAPSLADLAFCVLAGGYVCPFVGWYSVDSGGPNQYYKDGGHVITMIGLEGWCPGDDREIKVRDPGNGDSNRQVQAAFATNTYALQQLPGFFADNDGGGGIQVFYQRTHEQFMGYGSPALLNGYRVIVPKPGVTLSPLNPSLSLLRPIQLTNGSNPTHGNVGGLGGLGNITDFDVGADFFRGFVVNRRNVGTSTIDEVWQVALLDETAAPSAPEPNRMLFSYGDVRSISSGRNKDLYILAGDFPMAGGAPQTSIVRIDHDGSQAAVPIPSFMRNARRSSSSDTSEGIFVFDASSRHFAFVPDAGFDAGGPGPQVYPLPTGVEVIGDEYFSVSPNDGSLWLRSRGSPFIYNIVINPSSGAQVRLTGFVPDLIDAEGLDVQGTSLADERLLATKGGVVVEYTRNASGGWVRATDSDFAGLPARGGIKLARSRSNMNISPNDPSNFDVLPTTQAPNQYDCPGDVNLDGTVAFGDLTQLLAEYGFNGETSADVNGNLTVNFGDVTELLANWGPCR